MQLHKAFLIIALSLLFTACYPISNVEMDLVTPLGDPRSEMLKNLVSERYPTFVYQREGIENNTQDLIPLDGFDARMKAAYVLVNETETGPMHLLIIEDAEVPKLLYDVPCLTQKIQNISWADLNGDDRLELMVSYVSDDSSNGLFEAYTFSETVEKVFTSTFNNWVYGTLYESASPMLYVITETLTQEGIRLYTLEERNPANRFELVNQVHLDLNYGATHMIIGQVNDQQRGVFMDGVVGAHSGITEIVAPVAGGLKSLTQNEDEINESTYKPYYAETEDVDNDGILEVPFMTPAIGDEDLAMYETSWVYTWRELSAGGQWVDKAASVESYGIGRMLIPLSWVPSLGVETVYYQNSRSTMTLLYDDGEMRENWIEFSMIPSEDYRPEDYPNAVMIEEDPLFVLLLTVAENARDQGMTLSTEEIIAAFTPEPWLKD